MFAALTSPGNSQMLVPGIVETHSVKKQDCARFFDFSALYWWFDPKVIALVIALAMIRLTPMTGIGPCALNPTRR
ncbi:MULTISPECIES: hypothetical protein [Methylobacterium]|uniref:hypothetical protein n=1 Tax=Methylobacterium TaxID=407 RepID=UPI000F91AE4B|nr:MULTISPECIES: hypothetical protein [Methylobacterium]RUP13843.1 MAG: hypothetical protein EKK43_14795 [Methylobacterium sp.]